MHETHLPTGLKAKAHDLIAALTALKSVEREQRPPTDDEMQALRKFGGFGAVALHIFPDPVSGQFKDGWAETGRELKALLTPEEYDSAKRTTFSQFFTAPAVMRAMHDSLSRLGVPASGSVLEPGCGTGNFMTGPHRYVGVELDSVTGRIARLLHPQADIRIENFRDTKLPQLDGVIGNVPFADVKLDFRGQKLALHDFFLAKSLDAVKPGGVMAVVTSHYTLDKQNAAAREQLAAHADFLGAIRLPSDAFKREGTAVVTDILFLRKRAPGQEPKHADPSWLETGPLNVDDATVAVNRYFLNHPEMVLGQWSSKDTLYGGEGYSVTSTGDLATQLRIAVGKLPRFEPTRTEAQNANPPPNGKSHQVNGSHPKVNGSLPKVSAPDHKVTPPFVPPPPLKHISESSLFTGDDKVIRQVENGTSEPVVYCGVTLKADGTPQGRKIGQLIELRDLARRVLQSQNEGWPDHARDAARRNLNHAYDRFVSQHGPVNKTTFTETKTGTIRRMPNLVKFREDPDAMLVMSLEEYDEATGKAEKAAIMRQDVVGPKPPVTRVASAEEGLLVSLDHRGGIDLPYISKLYGKPEAEIVTELGDLIYRDPATKRWETADAYLSGNVREKLTRARSAGPEYARNVAALEQVQPEDVLPGDIDANLGAPWIPASDIQAFAAELFGVPSEAVKISHLPKDALWCLEPDYRALNSVAATADFGTGRINGTTLLEMALNLKTPIIYDTISTASGGEQRVMNPTETLAAKEKQRQIKERFKAWVFSDPDRTERLVRDYNDAFNNLRPRLFDGSHLEFPGMSKAIELRQSQKDAIWRGMTAGNTLWAHAVGAGKTWITAATAMKMRQAGLVKKPLIAVPNHMLEQFSREFLQLYPNARVLMAGKDDFTTERRKLLTAKIATGDWDAVIVTHSGFERMGMSPEFQERFLREQIAEYESLLIDRTTSGRNIIKTIEKQKAAREEKLKGLLAEDKKDSGLVFDELGVDQIMVDECFTHDTLVETDRGLMKIGDIVNERLSVRLKSLNLATGALEWRPVVNWFPNKRKGALVEVVHEDGSFLCTPRHKLWVSGKGYKKASEIAPGEELLVLRRGLHSEVHQQQWASGEVLHTGMQNRSPNDHEDVRRVWKPVLISDDQSGQRDQASAPILQCELQNEGTAGQPQVGGQVPGVHAADMGQSPDERQAESKSFRMDDGKQPHEKQRDESQAVEHAPLHRPQAQDSWRQRKTPDSAPNVTGGKDGHGHGASDPHQVDPTPDGKSGEALQGGSGRPEPDVGGGSGRAQPQLARRESPRLQEGHGLVASRVVRVTVLEPGSDGEYRFGGRDHSVVYDIEVEGNHNYFANGVLVSNCHAYKNLETPTKMERVAGIQTSGSERAFDLLMKAKYLDERHPGHGLIGASGTPISNSMVEMYTMQRLFDPKGLRDRGIEHFDGWAATFGEVVEAMEISPDGATLKPRSRFAKFVNLPELVQMFRSFADVQTAEMLNLPRPALEGGKPQTVACPMSEEQCELQAKLVERYERIRNTKVDPREDNALAITTDGRKLALDGRMLHGREDFPGSKVNALVANVRRIWGNTAEKRGTQMIFCDMGVHPNPFSVYDEIASKLADHGIPASQIAVMGDADTDAKKQALFEKVRQGSVRVLIGSTAKMGTGTNVQKRLVALHHLDAPWKPAEVEQREGRILRQGNLNPEVAIYRYVTEGSFDAYMWQALETKAKFIGQVMTGDCAVRKAEDVGGQELSYAEVKAIASGNPAVLTLAEADAELQRLAILRKNHHDEQYLARRNLKELPDRIRSLDRRIENLTADMATLEAHEHDRVAVGNRPMSRDDAAAALTERLDRLPDKVNETRTVPMGTYRGLAFGVILHSFGAPDAYLEGRTTRRTELRGGGRALLNALDRLTNGYGPEHERCQQDKAVAEGQLADYESRLGTEFRHGGYERQLAELRDKLRAGLSEKVAETEDGPSVAELDAQIKALRAANAVEAAPARIGVKPQARAEKPVTARIARAEPEPLAEPVAEEPPAKPADDESDDTPGGSVIQMPPPPKPPAPTHAGQVTQRRKPVQMSLF